MGSPWLPSAGLRNALPINEGKKELTREKERTKITLKSKSAAKTQRLVHGRGLMCDRSTVESRKVVTDFEML